MTTHFIYIGENYPPPTYQRIYSESLTTGEQYDVCCRIGGTTGDVIQIKHHEKKCPTGVTRRF
jgi:uncharacterized metal-binding protein